MADVTLPQLGETVTEGTITRWFKKVGDSVAADEPLFEVSTDKVDTEVPSPISGTRHRDPRPGRRHRSRRCRDRRRRRSRRALQRRRPAAEPRPLLLSLPLPKRLPLPRSPLRRRCRRRHLPPRHPHRAGTRSRGTVAAPAAAPAAEAPAPAAAEADAPSDNRLLSPVVRRLVAEHNINVDLVKGTGPGGRVTRDDVLDYIDQVATQTPLAAPPAARCCSCRSCCSPGRTGSPGRRSDAHCTCPRPSRDARRARLDRAAVEDPQAHRQPHGDEQGRQPACVQRGRGRLRQRRHHPQQGQGGVEGRRRASGSPTSRSSLAPWSRRSSEYPHLNASVSDDDLVVHNFIDIGIAVDLDFQGLLVPVVRAAETKRLRAIAREINDLAGRARSRQLSPDEISGGTFTISNNGSAGSVLTMPIINQPQVAILSTDAIVRKPVVVHTHRRWRGHRDPPGRQPGHGVGPPCLRRRLRSRLPGQDQGSARDPRLGRRAVT